MYEISLLSKLAFEAEPSWDRIEVNATTRFTQPPRRLNYEQGL